MSTTFHEDVSSTVLRRMKEGGFDFARVHPIEFYAVFPSGTAPRPPPRTFAVKPSTPRSFRVRTEVGICRSAK